jgi:GT2 family glycosyltransferase
MAPLLTAELLLDPARPVDAAWARFDAGWYLARYPAARSYCGDDAAAALQYYLRAGAALGHSPSPLFDEAYYLASNPDVHELVRAGKYQSGFDHFCQHGHRALCPHWLFDDRLYGRLYEDMSLENLDHHRCYGRYDHYLKSGQFEHRTAQYLFDAAFYRLRAVEAGVAEAEVDAAGPYTHFLYRLQSGLAELRPSIYFEPGWYVENSPGVAADIARGLFRSAIEHYLCNDAPQLRDPVPQFSEAYYRSSYADVGQALENGYFRNGYQHFVQFGAFELRRPRAEIDLLYYRDSNARVRDDLNTGAVRDAFAHLRLIGLRENFAYAAPDAQPAVSEAMARQMFQLKARNNLAIFARRRLDFGGGGAPEVCVIMVLFNRFELTMLALASLRDNFAGGIELILVDNASSDDTARIERYVTGAAVLRLAENTGFPRAANLALAKASAPAVLYLNNDVELGHGAVRAALARLHGAANVGAVGAKVVRSHGNLQEAGSIIWRDGTTTGYLRDAQALAPAANFVRDVDYCSAVFLLCRADILKTLGGFDENFSPAYYEDADLCIRMAAEKYRIVYDPAVSVQHLEFGSAANSEASMVLMRRGHKIFQRKHAAYLKTKFEKLPRNLTLARGVAGARRVLFVEDTVPLRRLGSGFVRSNDVARAIDAAGFEVTVFPVNGAPHDIMSSFGDLPERVEVMHDRNINLLPEFLAERAGFYDLVWVSRTHNLRRVLPIFEAAGISAQALPFVLDTEAVVTLREAARQAAGEFGFLEHLREEFAGAEICRQILAVNRAEVELLRGLGLPAVCLLGTMREPSPTPNDFSGRSGLLFVAGMHQPDSPNLDALAWYVDAILPALAAEMGEPPVLHVVGYTGPEVSLARFAGLDGVKLHGAVDDLRPFYDACRVFIAPTRFAAGTPYKIYEAAAHGLPCVVTDLLAAQLGWQPGGDLTTAPVGDARRFAAQIAVLYRTETLWKKLRERALKRLLRDHAPADFEQAVRAVLQGALAAPGAGGSPLGRHRRAAG